MSQVLKPGIGNETVCQVDATAANEIVSLPSNFATGRKFTIRRTDSGASGHTVTVRVATGQYLDAVLNGTLVVGGNAEGWLSPSDPATWESYGLSSSSEAAAAYGPGSAQWLQSVGGSFGFSFATISTTDTATGLPTGATVRWPDGTAGTFTGTIDGGNNGYSGYVVTWVGSTTKTLTASGITYNVDGNALGPTGLVVT